MRIYRKSVVVHTFATTFATSLLTGALLMAPASRSYAVADTWVDGAMPLLNVVQQLTSLPPDDCIPTTWQYYTYDTRPTKEGHFANTTVCATQNQLGGFGGTFIRPNTTIAFRVLKPVGWEVGLTPVPNQPAFIYKAPHPYVAGLVVPHFYYGFGGNGIFDKYSYGSGVVPYDLAYYLQSPGDILKDAVGNTIYMRHYAFSQNGEWMVIEAPGLGLLRVNTMTREMQLFSTTMFSYDLGYSPYVSFAISDDGNSAIMGTEGGATTYDLSGCQPGLLKLGAGTANNAATKGCRSRNASQSLTAQMPGLQSLGKMRFSTDGKSVRALATRQALGGAREYYWVDYSVSGYQAPRAAYIALGDSFSSGEGAYAYEPGTDSTSPRNKCHLSTKSYPYLVSQALGITDFHSVACSGARTANYYNDSQGSLVISSPLGKWLPGVETQKQYLRDAGKTSVVTISMIGNDIGFSDKLKTCILGPTPCYHFREDRASIAQEIYGKFDTLVNLFRDIKRDSGNADSVRIYALGYPQIFGTGSSSSCGRNVTLDQEERRMASGLTSYLDEVIRAAAEKAGVQYIDTEQAFDGHRLCENGAKAVNGLSAGKSAPVTDVGPLGNESFHPSELGHKLMSQALLSQSQYFTKTMPIANNSKQAPYIGSTAYNEFVGDAPNGGKLSHLVYAGLQGAGVIPRKIGVKIDPTDVVMMPTRQVEVWLNSDPVFLGSMMSDTEGRVQGQITIPDSVEPGFHTLHIYGKDLGGQDVDVYQIVYVAANMDDYNGDGVPNSQDACLILPASGIDIDQDLVDDACDPVIGDPPVQITGSPVADAGDNDGSTLVAGAANVGLQNESPQQTASIGLQNTGLLPSGSYGSVLGAQNESIGPKITTSPDTASVRQNNLWFETVAASFGLFLLMALYLWRHAKRA